MKIILFTLIFLIIITPVSSQEMDLDTEKLRSFLESEEVGIGKQIDRVRGLLNSGKLTKSALISIAESDKLWNDNLNLSGEMRGAKSMLAFDLTPEFSEYGIPFDDNAFYKDSEYRKEIGEQLRNAAPIIASASNEPAPKGSIPPHPIPNGESSNQGEVSQDPKSGAGEPQSDDLRRSPTMKIIFIALLTLLTIWIVKILFFTRKKN